MTLNCYCARILLEKPSTDSHPLPVDVYAEIHSIDLLQILLNLTTNALQCTDEMHQVQIEALYPRSCPTRRC